MPSSERCVNISPFSKGAIIDRLIFSFSMPDLQTVYQKIKLAKKERKKLQDMYREGLTNSKTYKETIDQIKELQAKKLRIETQTKQEFQREMQDLDKLKSDIDSNNILLSDMALTSFMKGESINFKDENDVEYEPAFSVKFKKAN